MSGEIFDMHCEVIDLPDAVYRPTTGYRAVHMEAGVTGFWVGRYAVRPHRTPAAEIIDPGASCGPSCGKGVNGFICRGLCLPGDAEAQP